MKKNFKTLKFRLGIIIATAIMALGLGACGQKAAEGKASTTPSAAVEKTVPSGDTPSDNSVPSSGSNEKQLPESSEASETGDEGNTQDISAADEINLIEDLSARYPNISKDELAAFVFSINFDYLTEEDKATILSTYGKSYEEFSALFNDYCMSCRKMAQKNRSYHIGSISDLPVELDYDNWAKCSEMVLNSDDMELAQRYDTFLYNETHGLAYEYITQEFDESTFYKTNNSATISFVDLEICVLYGNQMDIPNNVFQMQLER